MIELLRKWLSRTLAAVAIPLIASCGGGGGGESGGSPDKSGGGNGGGGSQNPPSAWTSVAAFGAMYGGTPAGQSLAGANDAQAHFLFGEYVNVSTTSLQALHRPASGSWDASLILAPPVAFASGTRSYDGPIVRVDDSGGALAVWTYRDSSDPSDRNWTSQVSSSRRDPSTGIWSTPQVLESASPGYARDVDVVIEPNGLAWAVWTERTFKDAFFSTNDQYAIFASRYDPGSGWTTPEKVTGDLKWRLSAKVATDRHGNPRVMIAWNSGVPLESTLYASRRSAGGAWGMLETLAFAVPVGGLAPDFSEYGLAVDGDDAAIAVWREWDGTRYIIRSRRYTVLGGWESAVELQLSSQDSGFGPQLAMDDAGNAFVAWHEFDGISYAIWTARFEKNSGWASLELISSAATTPGDDSTFPKISFDQLGNAVAIWTKHAASLNQTVVRANYYSKTNGWGLDETISTGPGISWRSELAVSRSGYATALWWQEIGNLFQAWSATRAPTTP